MITHELIVYIPLVRWADLESSLPPDYTYYDAVGCWKGQQEKVRVLTVLGHGHDLSLLSQQIAERMLELGEETILYALKPLNATLVRGMLQLVQELEKPVDGYRKTGDFGMDVLERYFTET